MSSAKSSNSKRLGPCCPCWSDHPNKPCPKLVYKKVHALPTYRHPLARMKYKMKPNVDGHQDIDNYQDVKMFRYDYHRSICPRCDKSHHQRVLKRQKSLVKRKERAIKQGARQEKAASRKASASTKKDATKQEAKQEKDTV